MNLKEIFVLPPQTDYKCFGFFNLKVPNQTKTRIKLGKKNDVKNKIMEQY